MGASHSHRSSNSSSCWITRHNSAWDCNPCSCCECGCVEVCGQRPISRERVSVGAFGAPVFMPSTITLKILGVSQTGVWFEVVNGEGMQAIRDGYVGFRSKQSAL